MNRFVLAAALLMLPATAYADRAEADACAKSLTGEALNTYNAGIALAQNGSTLEQAVRPYLQPLHDAGKISTDDAHTVGKAAAMCLRLVHHKESIDDIQNRYEKR